MKNKILMFVLLGLLNLASLSGAYAASADQIMVNGSLQILTKPMQITEDKVLISLRDLATAVGGTVSWDSSKGEALIERAGKTYHFLPGNLIVQVTDGMALSMARPAENSGGTIYLPLNAAKDIFDVLIALDGDYYSISTGSVALEGSATLDELVKLAIENSTSYQNAVVNVARYELTYDEAKDDLGNSAPYDTGNSAQEATRLAAYQSYFANGVGLETSKRALETSKAKIENQIKKDIETIQSGEKTLALLKKQISVTAKDTANSELKFQVGLISKLDYEKTKLALSDLQKSYDMQALVVDKSWEDLNHAVGKNLADRYGIKYNVAYEVFKGTLDDLYREALSDSPDIYGLEKQIELAKNKLTYYVFNYSSSPYDVVEIDVTLAKNTLESTKKTYKETIMSYLNGIKTLESKRDQLKLEYQSALLDADKVNKSVQAGLATPLDYEKAKLAVETLENNILMTETSHAQSVRAIQKIWAIN